MVIDFNKEILINRIKRFSDSKYNDDEIRRWLFPDRKDGKYLAGDSRGWKLTDARKKIVDNHHLDYIERIDYRPFDTRKIYYTPDMVDWGREKLMFNFISKENIGLILGRQATNKSWTNVQISKNMIDNRYHFSYKGIPSEYPLYLYPEESAQSSMGDENRKPNFNSEIINKIIDKLGLSFVPEETDKTGDQKEFAPIDLLDYIYAVLHSPTYRETYKEFLKIDFPRVPYPEDQQQFWKLVELGGKLRKIHLLEDPVVEDYITTYPKDGTNEITRRLTKTKPGFVPEKENPEIGKVWINDEQYFDNVPKTAWEFYIGGYQPAQKWLKDRRDRILEFDDILHYQKIIVALAETERLMKEIDGVGFLDKN